MVVGVTEEASGQASEVGVALGIKSQVKKRFCLLVKVSAATPQAQTIPAART